jgi:antitoxin component YwqK of YwqJK toxin-antitoxin module
MNKPEYNIYPNGNKSWFLNGKYHREDGPALEYASGDKFWFLNDKLHREDGPAVEYPGGTKEWYLNGNLHREDGPACEYTNGNKYWYLNHKEVHPETIVDLWLSRGVFCWYDQTNDCLNFGEKNEQA